MRAGTFSICSQLSCTGGLVKRCSIETEWDEKTKNVDVYLVRFGNV